MTYTEAHELMTQYIAKLQELYPDTYAYYITGVFRTLAPEILTGTLSLESIRNVLASEIETTLKTTKNV